MSTMIYLIIIGFFFWLIRYKYVNGEYLPEELYRANSEEWVLAISILQNVLLASKKLFVNELYHIICSGLIVVLLIPLVIFVYTFVKNKKLPNWLNWYKIEGYKVKEELLKEE